MSSRSENIYTKPIFKSLSWSKLSRSNRLFLLSFENENDRASHSEYYLSKVEIKDYNVKIDGRKRFD